VRRLHQGHFTWPQTADTLFTLSQAEWAWLICGVDWQRLQAQAQGGWQV
jgi:transposase